MWEEYVRINESGIGDPLDSLTSSTQPGTQLPRINTCCPCVGCLNACIRENESGGESDSCNTPETGCDKGLGCDCGPYQIDHKDYVHDICGPIGPCSNGDGGYDNTCCEVCSPGYGDWLCEGCDSSSPGGKSACCAEKERRSKKLMDCYRRRWTRNNTCEGNGNEVNPYPDGSLTCFTCQDLARMHQGGFNAPCQKSTANDTYWNEVKACMARKCGYTVSADGTEVCEYISQL